MLKGPSTIISRNLPPKIKILSLFCVTNFNTAWFLFHHKNLETFLIKIDRRKKKIMLSACDIHNFNSILILILRFFYCYLKVIISIPAWNVVHFIRSSLESFQYKNIIHFRWSHWSIKCQDMFLCLPLRQFISGRILWNSSLSLNKSVLVSAYVYMNILIH